MAQHSITYWCINSCDLNAYIGSCCLEQYEKITSYQCLNLNVLTLSLLSLRIWTAAWNCLPLSLRLNNWSQKYKVKSNVDFVCHWRQSWYSGYTTLPACILTCVMLQPVVRLRLNFTSSQRTHQYDVWHYTLLISSNYYITTWHWLTKGLQRWAGTIKLLLMHSWSLPVLCL